MRVDWISVELGDGDGIYPALVAILRDLGADVRPVPSRPEFYFGHFCSNLVWLNERAMRIDQDQEIGITLLGPPDLVDIVVRRLEARSRV